MVERYEAYVLSKEYFCDIEIEVEPEGSFVYYDDYAKLEATIDQLHISLAGCSEENASYRKENQELKQVIKRALEYNLEPVMRRSDIRKLRRAVGYGVEYDG